ncbi:Ubiquinone biosynthesis protein coq9 [Escovopsis weberi]|uniref:Ubiquinone biosynthesis protein n=1 Tax=Escovopsis weberi TaxID=150374 RepID=A0A0M9VSF8_ESCWE|nr:Ubiquinone biosynthesis protein coq9 [Escovopsis weberi]
MCSRHPPRSYHSYDHPPPRAPFGDVEKSILAAAYKHVPDHGFSERALGLGARDAGYLDISPAVFPDGAFSLIRYHLVTRRAGLAAQSRDILGEQQQDDKQRVAANVAALTWARLLENKDVIRRWQEALAIMAQPSYLPESLRELAVLSDEICFLAGDQAVDPSWYAKRAALSMVYSSSELFMTNDRSPGFIETNRFMQRRLDESQLLGGAIASIGQFAGFTFSAGLNVLRSKGVPI